MAAFVIFRGGRDLLMAPYPLCFILAVLAILAGWPKKRRVHRHRNGAPFSGGSRRDRTGFTDHWID
ncbi:hypothetical protein OM960_22465 [Defluviimonas sp. CAU 1641]|uniref:Uncharacterized protein n=1 Tax=Defluviimonas salinarum TaxID=2992147 RepID=A0ABT3J9E0_9RHOB|nr:hypothetical protein [Defluviimonas salinarum]